MTCCSNFNIENKAEPAPKIIVRKKEGTVISVDELQIGDTLVYEVGADIVIPEIPEVTAGEPGPPGKSLYTIWLEEGNVGTEQDMIDSFKGAPGTPGTSYPPPVNGEPGAKGADGVTPVIKIGTVTLGDEPSASITGSTLNPELNLVFPKPKDGEDGEDGVIGGDVQSSGTFTSANNVQYMDFGTANHPGLYVTSAWQTCASTVVKNNSTRDRIYRVYTEVGVTSDGRWDDFVWRMMVNGALHKGMTYKNLLEYVAPQLGNIFNMEAYFKLTPGQAITVSTEMSALTGYSNYNFRRTISNIIAYAID